jgi:hypothetical protein
MKVNDAGRGLAVDLGLVALDTGSTAPQRGFRAFKMRGAALNGLMTPQDMFVRSLIQRCAARMQAPGTLLDKAFSLIQGMLTTVGAALPLIGDPFPTIGSVLALVSEAITLVGDGVAPVGRFRPQLPGALWRPTLAAGGPR